MYLMHHASRSEWDDAYMNFRVSTVDTQLAGVIVGIFTLVLLLF